MLQNATAEACLQKSKVGQHFKDISNMCQSTGSYCVSVMHVHPLVNETESVMISADFMLAEHNLWEQLCSCSAALAKACLRIAKPMICVLPHHPCRRSGTSDIGCLLNKNGRFLPVDLSLRLIFGLVLWSDSELQIEKGQTCT